MVETRSKSRKTIAKSKSKSSPSSKDECYELDPHLRKCPDPGVSITSKPVASGSVLYNKFVNTFLKSCTPYKGKKVFVVHKNSGNVEYVCPMYKVRIGHYNLSVSLERNGYMYIHFLQDFMPNSQDCVYSGDHITIAPTGKTHIHFHITNIMYHVDSYGNIVHASSQNTSFCTLPIADMNSVFRDKTMNAIFKKNWLLSVSCTNEYNVSFNRTALEMLHGDRDTFDVVFRIFLRGFA